MIFSPFLSFLVRLVSGSLLSYRMAVASSFFFLYGLLCIFMHWTVVTFLPSCFPHLLTTGFLCAGSSCSCLFWRCGISSSLHTPCVFLSHAAVSTFAFLLFFLWYACVMRSCWRSYMTVRFLAVVARNAEHLVFALCPLGEVFLFFLCKGRRHRWTKSTGFLTSAYFGTKDWQLSVFSSLAALLAKYGFPVFSSVIPCSDAFMSCLSSAS